MKSIKVVLLFVVLLTACGCGVQPAMVSSPFSTPIQTGIGAGGGEKNVAVLIGAPNGLGGVPTDITKLTELFADPTYKLQVVSDNNATVRELLDLTKAQAADADSMLWYFSGHGNDGVMLADDRTFTFNEVAAVIREARGPNKPLHRLLVFIDSCLSGSFVNGGSSIITEEEVTVEMHQAWNESVVYQAVEEYSDLYEQAFVMSASKKNENSADLGSAKGGAFTYVWRTKMAELKAQNELTTFKDMADVVTTKTDADYGHTPQYKAFPSVEVLNDYVFMYRMVEGH